MKIQEVGKRKLFKLVNPGVNQPDTEYQIMGPVMTEEEYPRAGYVISTKENPLQVAMWVENDTEVKLVTTEQSTNDTQKSLEQSYQQYINDPTGELLNKIEEMKQKALIDVQVADLCGKENMEAGTPYRGYEVTVQVENTPEQQEIIEKIRKLQTEGINSDQEDKSPMEEYADAIAEHRMIEELEEKLKKISTANYMQVVPDSHHYTALEHIIEDLKYSSKEEVTKRLQTTIAYGYYINTRPTE